MEIAECLKDSLYRHNLHYERPQDVMIIHEDESESINQARQDIHSTNTCVIP